MAEPAAPATGATEPQQDDDEGYTGPATVVVDGEEIRVEVRLECRHEPFDGRVHWSGRIRAHPRLSELIGDGGAEVEIRTDGHAATGRLAEVDMWQRYRATGVGHPPFAMDPPPSPETD